jgi:ABC-type transport system involved in cytochrome bd biosynthesis fused ATPase/permease subunit
MPAPGGEHKWLAASLSGGEQRRLHIARALATHVLAAIRGRLRLVVVVLAMHELPANPNAPRPCMVDSAED